MAKVALFMTPSFVAILFSSNLVAQTNTLTQTSVTGRYTYTAEDPVGGDACTSIDDVIDGMGPGAEIRIAEAVALNASAQCRGDVKKISDVKAHARCAFGRYIVTWSADFSCHHAGSFEVSGASPHCRDVSPDVSWEELGRMAEKNMLERAKVACGVEHPAVQSSPTEFIRGPVCYGLRRYAKANFSCADEK